MTWNFLVAARGGSLVFVGYGIQCGAGAGALISAPAGSKWNVLDASTRAVGRGRVGDVHACLRRCLQKLSELIVEAG